MRGGLLVATGVVLVLAVAWVWVVSSHIGLQRYEELSAACQSAEFLAAQMQARVKMNEEQEHDASEVKLDTTMTRLFHSLQDQKSIWERLLNDTKLAFRDHSYCPLLLRFSNSTSSALLSLADACFLMDWEEGHIDALLVAANLLSLPADVGCSVDMSAHIHRAAILEELIALDAAYLPFRMMYATELLCLEREEAPDAIEKIKAQMRTAKDRSSEDEEVAQWAAFLTSTDNFAKLQSLPEFTVPVRRKYNLRSPIVHLCYNLPRVFPQ